MEKLSIQLHKTGKIVPTLLFLLLSPQLALASGASGQKQGTGYVQISYLPLLGKTFFNSEGNFEVFDYYSRHSALFYGEYGIWGDGLALVYMSDFIYHSLEPNQSSVGMGDGNLQLHYRFYQGKINLGAGFGLGLPLGYYNPNVNLYEGDGEFDFSLRLFAKYKKWNGHVSYRLRQNGYDNDIQFGFGYKHKAFKKTYLSYGVGGLLRTEGDYPRESNPYVGFSEGVEYLAYYLSLFHSLSSHFHLTFGLGGGIPSGLNRNLIGNAYITPGLGYSF